MRDSVKTVLVFKTSVSKSMEVRQLRPLLNELTYQNGSWNFDLEDCDNILRVETKKLQPQFVTATLQKHGFFCEEII